MHGYEIKKIYDQSLEGLVTLHHNQLYPALRRFEEIGAVRGEAIEQQGKPDRIMYHLTDQGFTLLRTMLCDFSPTIALNDMEFYVRFALFGYLETEERLTILRTRSRALQARLQVSERLHRYRDIPLVDKIQPYVEQLKKFREHQMSIELQWLEAMIEQVG
jgi:DNA-binding PadR family transcriptional regulator